MTKKLVALAATALAVLLVSSPFEPADAKKGGGWSGGGGKFHGGGRFHGGGKFYGGKIYGGSKFYGGKIHHGHKFAHFRNRHVFVGAPVYYGAYYYADGCYALKRRAIYTDSSYWWNRYYACIDGYSYYD